MLISVFKYLFHYSYKYLTAAIILKWLFTIKIVTTIIKLRLGNMFYSNMQLKSHYLQFCIKRNIRNADEQKPISQISAISVYV